MQKKMLGFTLLELMIVIVIIGVMATLGFGQYQNLIEKGRHAEAKEVIGMLRKQAYVYYMENNNKVDGLVNASVGIGEGTGAIPQVCNASNYFSYGVADGPTGNKVSFIATRCTKEGKPPNSGVAYKISLTAYLDGTSQDNWKTEAASAAAAE